jgi:predicted acylesterase/phospholipase RssA
MLRKTVLLTIPLLTLLPAAGRAALYSDQDCNDRLPQVLNVGLPYAREILDIRYEAVQKSARELFQGLYRTHAPCGATQRLQVNLAIGNDYQILDWLSRGLVDVAVVPTLSVYLLQRDRVEIRALDLDGKVDDFLLRSWQPWLRSRQARGGEWRERDDPSDDFAAFREALWCGVVGDGAEAPERRRCAKLSRTAVRLVLPSHLSTPGFLTPVSAVNTWLEDRLTSLDARTGSGETARLRDAFWRAFFDNVLFTLGEDERDSRVQPPGLVEVLVDAGGPPQKGVPLGPASRDYLVITERAANTVFQRGRFPAPQIDIASDLRAVLEVESPPRAFASLLEVEPYFGVRTFGFTVEESIGLLRQHQRTSRRARLALLLPGGGVKAAYQSRLVDELYQKRHLKNVLTAGEDGGRPPLEVDFVVGTSGGALLGYFVARLAENGPWNLSKVLWEKKENGVERVLDSTDIFGWLDLPRYVSVLAIFLTLSSLLALVSVRQQPLVQGDLPPERGAWRLRLTLVLWPLLLLVPVLVRVVNGRSSQEHIPEIEGLFYAVCASIVMFADQCFVLRRGEAGERKRPLVPPLLLALPGVALVVVPLLPAWGPEGERWVDRTVSFAAAFPILALLLAGAGLLLPFRLLRSGTLFRRKLLLAFGELVAAGGLVLFIPALPGNPLGVLDRIIPFLLAFALLLLLVGAPQPVRSRHGRVATSSRRGAYYVALLTACLVALFLSRPEDVTPGGVPLLFRESQLHIHWGAFLVCLGCLCLLGAAILWAQASRHYRLEGGRDFWAGFSLSLFHVLAVYIVLILVMLARPGLLSPLELTGGFWAWLLPVAAAVGGLLVWLGCTGRGGVGQSAQRGLRFLCSHHPNGSLISRRFARLSVVSVVCLGWWNFVLAPGVYGNKHARGFLQGAVARFEQEYGMQHPGESPHRLTAQLLVPANALERDGTRYFLVVPEDLPECPSISREPGSGASWHQYRVRVGDRPAGDGRCPGMVDVDPEDVREVVFASGSPFPVFPAHFVPVPGEEGERELEPLVDGGYTSNVPVDAARTIAAEQVLIVESENPLGHGSSEVAAEGGLFGLPGPGPLLAGLLQLPGFLFERSQQVDRLSKRNLFVVSLSPSREEPDWPLLVDFRESTVKRMRRVAEADLFRRIGLVESWGPPRFQLSVQVGGGKAPS